MTPRFLVLRVVIPLILAWVPFGARAEQFVEVTAKVDFAMFTSRNPSDPPTMDLYQARCVVGTNMWMIEGDFMNSAQVTLWFTGSNIVEHTRPAAPPGTETAAKGTGERAKRSTKTYGGPKDGNVQNPLIHLFWLAICSGPHLTPEGRKISLALSAAPPNRSRMSPAREELVVFPDALGLPRSLKVYGPTNRLVWDYRAVQTTNFLDWTFPTRFEAASYRAATRNGVVKTNFSYSGTIISIRAADEPKIPPAVFDYLK